MVDILIVEDDIDLTETYQDLLEAHGYSVATASRISEASTLLTSSHPQVITLDLNLPGSSNASIITFMRAAKMGKSKIIVISGHPEMMSGAEWMDYIDLVLTKPVESRQLTLMVERLFQVGAKK